MRPFMILAAALHATPAPAQTSPPLDCAHVIVGELRAMAASANAQRRQFGNFCLGKNTRDIFLAMGDRFGDGKRATLTLRLTNRYLSRALAAAPATGNTAREARRLREQNLADIGRVRRIGIGVRT